MNSPSSAASLHSTPAVPDSAALTACARQIRAWARELGFSEIGISHAEVESQPALVAVQAQLEAGYQAWLRAGYHGTMDYMAKHGVKRLRPAELVPGTLRVISVRLNYLPAQLAGHHDEAEDAASSPEMTAAQKPDWRAVEWERLSEPTQAVVSLYARGRDYHKVMRQRLQQLAQRITDRIGPYGYRVFTDSAPVLEVEWARRAQLGWRGKHTLLLNRQHGSFFFLGEIYVDLPLPVSAESLGASDGAQCGSCTRCLSVCPTGAIIAPYRLDARRCISYLTIELKGSIPRELRTLIGNRIVGCDDCQLVCPWNKFAQLTTLDDFAPRHGLERATLLELFEWSATQFDERLAGSAIRRIGHEQWLRNIAVALGNALRSDQLDAAQREAIIAALRRRAEDASPLVREHIDWALEEA